MTENRPDRKKKIAFVSNSAWSVFNFRLDVIRHLLPKYQILVIAPSDEFSSLLVDEGCFFIPISFNNRSENPLREFSLYKQLKQLYTQEQPDLIFHYVIKPNIYGSLAAAACHIPSVAVVTGLGYAFAKQNWLYRTVSVLYKRAFRKTNQVWFLNQADADVFTRGKLVDPAKVRLLPGEGVNSSYFAPAGYRPVARNKTFQFLMSTRLLKSKGVRIYAEAARILKQKKLDLRVVLIGFSNNSIPIPSLNWNCGCGSDAGCCSIAVLRMMCAPSCGRQTALYFLLSIAKAYHAACWKQRLWNCRSLHQGTAVALKWLKTGLMDYW